LVFRWAAGCGVPRHRRKGRRNSIHQSGFRSQRPGLPVQPSGTLDRVPACKGNQQDSTAPSISPGETVKRYWKILRSPRVAGFAPAWIAINAVLGIWINLSARILTDKSGFPHQILVGSSTVSPPGTCALYMQSSLSWHPGLEHFLSHPEKDHHHADWQRRIDRLLPADFRDQSPASLERTLGAAVVDLARYQHHGAERLYPSCPGSPADITEAHDTDRGAIMGLYSVFLGLGQFLGPVWAAFCGLARADGMALITGMLESSRPGWSFGAYIDSAAGLSNR